MRYMALLFAVSLAAQQPPMMPPWLKNYGDVTGQTSASRWLVESTYEVAAAPAAVIAHYGKLFETAGLAFHPNSNGMGVTIRGSAPECDLLIAIRGQGSGTSVRVSCAARETAAPEKPATAAPAAAPRPAVESAHERGLTSMRKYDQPVYSPPKPPLPRLVWPGWMTAPDGRPIDGRKVERVGLYLLRTSFVTDRGKDEVRSFYQELLESHGYVVRNQSMASMPEHTKGWIEAARYTGGADGPHVSIYVEFTPQDRGMRVDVRVTESR